MAKPKVDVETKNFLSWLRKTDNGIAKDMKLTLAKYTALIEGKAVDWCPVDTGYLQSTISKEIRSGGTVGIVKVTANYARYVELGTSVNYAQPFLLPAFNVHSEKFIEELLSKINKYL